MSLKQNGGEGDGTEVCSVSHATGSGRAATPAPLELDESQRMGEFFSVLSDPTRLRLISLLYRNEFCVCDLAERLGISESAVSHQLRALRGARLVKYRKEGRQVFYQLHDHHIVELYSTVREHLAEP